MKALTTFLRNLVGLFVYFVLFFLILYTEVPFKECVIYSTILSLFFGILNEIHSDLTKIINNK